MVFPDPAGMGHAPHILANAASDLIQFRALVFASTGPLISTWRVTRPGAGAGSDQLGSRRSGSVSASTPSTIAVGPFTEYVLVSSRPEVVPLPDGTEYAVGGRRPDDRAPSPRLSPAGAAHQGGRGAGAGEPGGFRQGLQSMLADMAMELEAARQMVYVAAAKSERNDPDLSFFGAAARCFAADVAMKVTVHAVRCSSVPAASRTTPSSA